MLACPQILETDFSGCVTFVTYVISTSMSSVTALNAASLPSLTMSRNWLSGPRVNHKDPR